MYRYYIMSLFDVSVVFLRTEDGYNKLVKENSSIGIVSNWEPVTLSDTDKAMLIPIIGDVTYYISRQKAA